MNIMTYDGLGDNASVLKAIQSSYKDALYEGDNIGEGLVCFLTFRLLEHG